MKYNLNDKPGIPHLLMYGLQWFIVTIPSIIIIGIVAGGISSGDASEQVFYMQKLFIAMGLITVVQILWGHKLPLVIGPASVLLVGIVSAQSSGAAATYTAIMVGGALTALLALSGLLRRIRFLFTSRVITVILILIAITLSPVILKLIVSDKPHASFNLIFALLLTLVLVVTNYAMKGVWKSMTIVIGLIGGTVVYSLLKGFSGFPQAETSIAGFAVSPSSFFFPFNPEFNVGTILAFVFCFIALIINELGSIEAVGQMLKADRLDRRVKRGTSILGISNLVTGSMGIIGPVDFSMSAGVIASTQCASRYTLIPAGLALVACALFPPVIEIFSGVPGVVLGCVMLYLMATQFASGLQMLILEKSIGSFNDALIIALSLMVAMMISFAPQEAFEPFPTLLRPILCNGFVMGVITVLLLEHLVFRHSKN
ncbi:MAG: purine/pyrimidine permease [Mediterranea sp.]|jgi:xanthine/uracil permease|nr:purine/pyrimidine permease [Mediterranea sp.]